MNKSIGTAFFWLVLVFSQSGYAASEVERANPLIGEGEYIEAFELLEPLEFDLSGDENFDLLFGFTALKAGHVSLVPFVCVPLTPPLTPSLTFSLLHPLKKWSLRQPGAIHPAILRVRCVNGILRSL